jgi:Cys-tRNA(Pro)/Cys-tRNA(Cys) deacylase
MKKTNAARILDRHKQPYELYSYIVDEEDLSVSHVAQSIGVESKMLFKTLVTLNEKNQPIIAVVAGDKELNLKALASAAGCKKCTMLPMKELLKLTGYVRGGCSPLGMKKQFPTFIDQDALAHEMIFVSAGVRGLQLKLSPQILIEVLGAGVAALG